MCHLLQHYLRMRGDTTVSAGHHSEVQSCIFGAVIRPTKFYWNQASWYLSLQKVFCKVTCPLLYEHLFRRCRVNAGVNWIPGKHSSNKECTEACISDLGTKFAGRLIEDETCKTLRFHDWTPEYQQEQSTYHKYLNIETNTF